MCAYLSDSSPMDIDKYSEYKPSEDSFKDPSSSSIRLSARGSREKKTKPARTSKVEPIQLPSLVKWIPVETQMNLRSHELITKCENSILNLGVGGVECALDYFKLLFTRDIQEMIIKNTNLYSAKKPGLKSGYSSNLNIKITCEELLTLIGVLLNMHFVKLPSYEDYWHKSSALSDIPLIRNNMSKNRFLQILKNLHFSDIEKDQSNKINKLNDLYVMSNYQFKLLLIPGRNLTLDESMCPFKGHLSIKVFIPSKRARYGVKSFRLCSTEGYVLTDNIYYEKIRIMIFHRVSSL